jgi:hypothetical protein
MSVGPPPEGRVFEKTGTGVVSPRASGRLRKWVEEIRRKLGRPPRRDEQLAAWAARIEGPEFEDLPSLRKKCRWLAYLEYEEAGGDGAKLTDDEIERLGELHRVALSRWYKKRR